jgi:hypothetical protein
VEVAEYRPDMAYRARTVLLEGDEPPLREVLARFADGVLLVEEQGAVRAFLLSRVREVAGLEPVAKVDTDQITVPVRVR